MVTVVDSFNFFKDFGSPETLMDRKLTDIEDDMRTIYLNQSLQMLYY